MSTSSGILTHALSGIRKVGLVRSLQAAAYPLRRAYYDAKFAGVQNRGSVLRGVTGLLAAFRPPEHQDSVDPEDFVLLGDVLTHHQLGSDVTLRCENAALQLTVLTPDLLRVRQSPSGSFPEKDSYSVIKQDREWAPAPYTLLDGRQDIEIRTGRVTCRISKHPCRISFAEPDGTLIHSDTSGMGWLGRSAVRFAALQDDERVYGLGEKASRLDRRGNRYTMWNSDPQVYGPGQDPIYLNIPFYIGMRDGRGYGLFYDNTYRSQFDVGRTRRDEVAYLAEDGELCFYFFYGPGLPTIMERYTELTGRMPLPPLWALGYHQSRWSYYPESRVREIARLCREHRIPCDALHLDIHYMDGYRCFTWDRERFPQPSELVADLHDQGFRVVAMIDCGIKADTHYEVCADGLAKGMFCAYPDGSVAGGPVWPGECYFPDFTNPRVRQWWGELYGSLLDVGVDGIWNDMNEPTVMGPKGDTLAGCVYHDWEGKGSDHRQAHNVYGMQMVRATAEGLQRLCADERMFVFTRSGWAGVQRYAWSWTGDNESTWEHLRLAPSMVMGVGLSGLACSGPDVGGFEGAPEPELLVRWTQLGAFMPFFRNHTSVDSPDQEPWVHGEPFLTANRKAIELRYSLLPYLYTAAWQCAEKGWPIVRPMEWVYPLDSNAQALDDQFLCGDALLVAPVCEPEALSRPVYLPAGSWFDYWTGERHAGPVTLEVAAPLERIPVFVRAGTVLPTWPVMQYVDAEALDRLILHVYPGDGTSWLYEDDGHSAAHRTGDCRTIRYRCRYIGDTDLTIALGVTGSFRPPYVSTEYCVHGLPRMPLEVLVDGKPLRTSSTGESGVLRFGIRRGSHIKLA